MCFVCYYAKANDSRHDNSQRPVWEVKVKVNSDQNKQNYFTDEKFSDFQVFPVFPHTKYYWDQNKSPLKNNQNHFTDEKFVDFQPAWGEFVLHK